MRKHIFSLFITLSFLFTGGITAQNQDNALERARELLKSNILIDGHNDLMWAIREASQGIASYDLYKKTSGQTDIPRLKQGQVGGQFWSVWIPTTLENGFARVQLEQIELARRVIEKYSDTFSLALSADEIEQAFKTGHIASLIGLEGGHAIENSLGALRAYYRLGARYMTLTHNLTLDWADAALDSLKHNGLTPFGEEVVHEMNRLGMLVDLSHTSTETMSDVLDISEAPVIFSHASVRALTNHVRNVPDSILTRLADNDGIIMITFVPEFVSQEVLDWKEDSREKKKLLSAEAFKEYINKNPRPRATLQQVADHIEYARKICGIDYVGIGSDYDGSDDMPAGLEDVSCYPALFAELIRRGWSDEDLQKLAGQNMLRVFRKAEDVAKDIRTRRNASSRTIQDMDHAKE